MRNRQRGFALFTAVMMTGIIAIVIAAMASMTMFDIRRTRGTVVSAQLRALLIAGEMEVCGKLDVAGDQKLELSLPEELRRAGYVSTAMITALTADERSVEISARVDRITNRQQVTYHRESGKWKLISAELNPPAP